MIITDNEIKDWETVEIFVETEGVNKITVKMLHREPKYIYTFIKKNSPVDAVDVFKRFPKFDVKEILYNLRDSYLIFFKRKVK